MDILGTILAQVDSAKRVTKRNLTDLYQNPKAYAEKLLDTLNQGAWGKEAKIQDRELKNVKISQEEQMNSMLNNLFGSGGAGGVIGAFRPTGSVLSKELFNSIKDAVKWNANTHYQNNVSRVASTISDKELKKYGTPEFLLDDWLQSTQEGNVHLSVKKLDIQDILNSKEAANINKATEFRSALQNFSSDPVLKLDSKFTKKILENSDDISAFSKGTSVFGSDNTAQGYTASNDIRNMIENFAYDLETYGDIQVGDSSLQQLVSKVNQAKLIEAKQLAKSKELAADAVSQRTFNKPTQNGFVELTDLQDLSDETFFLNHCVGSVGSDGGKYIPALNPVTGKPPTRVVGVGHGPAYYKDILSGSTKIYSYRPNGVPEFTVEIDPSNGMVRQAYGPNDAPLTIDQQQVLESFINKPRYQLIPPEEQI